MFFNVEYENFSTICFKCGRIGHKMEACTSVRTSDNGVGSAEEVHPVKSPIEHGSYVEEGRVISDHSRG